jgi:hypothetical protein
MCWSRTRIVLVVLTALVVAVFGAVQLLAEQDAPPATQEKMATVDSLTAQVTNAVWTDMDHDMSPNAPGYQMPPAMMPGMPDGGDQRIAVHVTVTNTASDTRPLRPGKEFTLRAGKDGREIAPHSHTFGDLPRLPAGNAVNGILFFDLPPAELAQSPALLEWKHGDSVARITLPMDGATPGQDHSGGH